jgi:hypothetical protein
VRLCQQHSLSLQVLLLKLAHFFPSASSTPSPLLGPATNFSSQPGKNVTARECSVSQHVLAPFHAED